jgi:signal transduction histidine kinase
LGLAISFKRVKFFWGELQVESEPNKGEKLQDTVFRHVRSHGGIGPTPVAAVALRQ